MINPLFQDILFKMTSKEFLIFTFNQVEDIFTRKKRDILPVFIETVYDLGIIDEDGYIWSICI